MSDLTSKLFRIARVGLDNALFDAEETAEWIDNHAKQLNFTEFRIANPSGAKPKHRWMNASQIKKFVEYARAIAMLDRDFGVDLEAFRDFYDRHARAKGLLDKDVVVDDDLAAAKLQERKFFKPWLLELAEAYLEPMFRGKSKPMEPSRVPTRVRSTAERLLDGLHIIPSVDNIYDELGQPPAEDEKLAFKYSLKVIAELSGTEFEYKLEPVIRPKAKPTVKARAPKRRARKAKKVA